MLILHGTCTNCTLWVILHHKMAFSLISSLLYANTSSEICNDLHQKPYLLCYNPNEIIPNKFIFGFLMLIFSIYLLFFRMRRIQQQIPIVKMIVNKATTPIIIPFLFLTLRFTPIRTLWSSVYVMLTFFCGDSGTTVSFFVVIQSCNVIDNFWSFLQVIFNEINVLFIQLNQNVTTDCHKRFAFLFLSQFDVQNI